jgi:hypothetical protein
MQAVVAVLHEGKVAVEQEAGEEGGDVGEVKVEIPKPNRGWVSLLDTYNRFADCMS